MALRDVECLALGKRRLHEEVFPNYPEIMRSLKIDCFEGYNKHIFKPINTARFKEIQDMNRKSSYKNINFDLETDLDKEFTYNKNIQGQICTHGFNQHIYTENLRDTIKDFYDDLEDVEKQVKQQLQVFNKKLDSLAHKVDVI